MVDNKYVKKIVDNKRVYIHIVVCNGKISLANCRLVNYLSVSRDKNVE